MLQPPITAAWTTSNHPDSRPTLQVARGKPLWSVTARRLSEVQTVIAQAHSQSSKGLVVVGFVAYEAAPAFDPALPVRSSEAPLAHWQAYSQEQLEPFPCQSSGPLIWPEPWLDEFGSDWFEQSFDQIKAFIEAGEFYQLNLTTRLSSPVPETLQPWELFQRLFSAQPAAYSVFLDCGFQQILSLSPELFFHWNNGVLQTSPMKGTRKPGDQAQIPLQDSSKDRAENLMIVDLLRNDMARVCEPRSVQVRSLFDVLQLPTVEQMTSTIEGRTVADATLVDVFRALFPCGSVTGTPKRQAMLRIAELEAAPRGVYCGAMGLLEPGGSVRMNVPIRTLSLSDSMGTYGVGSGLTWDSGLLSERREWLQKTTFLRTATRDFEILETLRLQNQQWIRLEAHLRRMKHTAKHFGFVWPEASIRAALDQVARDVDLDAYRGRLTLSATGHLNIELHDLPEKPDYVHVQVADRPLVPNTHWIGHKTTNRTHYDAFSPTQAGVFDTLLFDSEGYLTEACRFNLVFQIGPDLVTPALVESGPANLLNGVFRASLLSENIVTSKALRLGDLARVERAWLINSLREWVEIDLISSHQGASLYVRQPSDLLKTTQ